jgi:hypothetical protein
MSIIKGFDRIFLIISIFSIMPVLYLTPNFVARKLAAENIEYRDYVRKIKNDIKNVSDEEVKKWKDDYCRKESEDFKKTGRIIPNSPGDPSCSDNPRELYSYHKYRELISKAPLRFKSVPASKVLSISFILAIVEAAILFVILKGTTRLIKWVVNGFSDSSP